MGLIDWFRGHPTISGWLLFGSALMFVASLIIMPILIARMRPDYFVSRRPSEDSWGGRHAAMRLVGLVAKNAAGVMLVVFGMAMLIGPGQGIITLLVGISLLNFPGKRRLELRIVRQRPVRKAIEWIRHRAKRPPLILPERKAD